MADYFMHAVQYDAYGGGAAALKVLNFHFHIFYFAFFCILQILWIWTLSVT